MESLQLSLQKTLADVFTMYFKAHTFHWNVEGPDFKQYHDLFGGIYEEVYGSIDTFAEEIRALNAYSPGSLKRFSELSAIQDENQIPDNITMAKRLLDDTAIVIVLLKQTFDFSEQFGEVGLSDFLAGRIDAFKKHAWMLRASTKI
jgi:starvation-inducible DNA-binding protein